LDNKIFVSIDVPFNREKKNTSDCLSYVTGEFFSVPLHHPFQQIITLKMEAVRYHETSEHL